MAVVSVYCSPVVCYLFFVSNAHTSASTTKEEHFIISCISAVFVPDEDPRGRNIVPLQFVYYVNAHYPY